MKTILKGEKQSMDDQPNAPTKTTAGTIVVTITSQGVEPPVIHTETAEAQTRMENICNLIQPCLDVADAIAKRADLGAMG